MANGVIEKKSIGELKLNVSSFSFTPNASEVYLLYVFGGAHAKMEDNIYCAVYLIIGNKFKTIYKGSDISISWDGTQYTVTSATETLAMGYRVL